MLVNYDSLPMLVNYKRMKQKTKREINRELRYKEFIKSLESQDPKVKKLIYMYLGLTRNSKPYSIRELAIYWNTTEDIISDIIREIMPH